jgi:hypothetical protein
MTSRCRPGVGAGHALEHVRQGLNRRAKKRRLEKAPFLFYQRFALTASLTASIMPPWFNGISSESA